MVNKPVYLFFYEIDFWYPDGWYVDYDTLDQVIDLCLDMGLEAITYEAGQLLINPTNLP